MTKIVHWTIKYTTDDGQEHYISEVPPWIADDIDELLDKEERSINE
jgi:hypothetical protein